MSLGDAATELHRGHNTAVFIFRLQVIIFFQYDNMSAQLTEMFRAGLWRSTPRWAATCQQGSGLPRSRVRGTQQEEGQFPARERLSLSMTSANFIALD